ncbi:MAG: hypothetical protein ABSH01_19565 [Terriglobia bacterium]
MSPATKGRDRKKPMDISQLLYVILLASAFAAAILWASITLFQYVWSQVRPSGEIVVGTFTTAGQGLPTDTKTVGTVLASKLERLKRVAGREPSGFGLVQTPILASVPDQVSERQSDARRRLEALNLKVKDVDVNAVVNAIRSVFAPARPTLEGQVTEIGDRFEIRAELLWKGNTIGGWVVSRTKSAQIQDTLNDLYDDLLFQIIYDIPRNPKLHWWAGAKGDDEIPNWQALEALTLGLQALQTYEQSLEYADLQRAIKHLQQIPVHAPGYALGHYFLAVALGEDRQEERAEGLLSEVGRMQASKRLKWSAAFQRAASMLRRYKGPAAEEAAKEVLDPLIKELQSASSDENKQSNAEEKRFARQLLPMAYAQLAYTYGTLFTLNSSLPKDGLRTSSINASGQAWNAFKAANAIWSSDRERKEVERWIYNTRGYSKFRVAQFERSEALKASEPPQEVNDKFREACQVALADLRKANEILPNNYEVLQNEAMILDDPDYDPEGAQLSEAEALYERTKLFVPRDYYQYERLAIIYWRQLKSHPPVSIQNTLIDKGQKAVSSVTVNRYPEKSRTAAVLGAYFSTCEAKLETDAAKKHSEIRDAIDQAELAVELNAPRNMALDTAILMKGIAGELKDSDPTESALKAKVLEVVNRLNGLKS